MEPQTKALVVFSGGQDSTTCLYWARNHFGHANIEALTFDYGQRHRIELECARTIAKHASVPHTVLPINTFAHFSGNALTDKAIAPDRVAANSEQLPNTFVPARNLIFLSFAAGFAYTRGIQHIVTGTAQVDYSSYPDCRENTLKALELALRLGMDSRLELHTPLMWLTKAETVRLAQDNGALEALAWSHTCYNGVQPPCGHCLACELRARGFAEAGIPDPLVQRFQNH